MMISINRLNKKFGDKVIFENFEFNVFPSEMIAIVGASGSGKTTLLNIIGLLDLDYEGIYKFRDINMAKIKEKKKSEFLRTEIGYLFQNYSLIDDETVSNNLQISMYKKKFSKVTKKELMIDALRRVGMDSSYLDKKIFLLSGGEQQRVALARLILKDCNIILADEPTGNLDDDNEKVVMSILRDFALEGKAVIVVTHNKHLFNYFDRVVTL